MLLEQLRCVRLDYFSNTATHCYNVGYQATKPPPKLRPSFCIISRQSALLYHIVFHMFRQMWRVSLPFICRQVLLSFLPALLLQHGLKLVAKYARRRSWLKPNKRIEGCGNMPGISTTSPICSFTCFCTIVCINQMRFVSFESHFPRCSSGSLGRTLACRDVETSLGCLIMSLMCL